MGCAASKQESSPMAPPSKVVLPTSSPVQAVNKTPFSSAPSAAESGAELPSAPAVPTAASSPVAPKQAGFAAPEDPPSVAAVKEALENSLAFMVAMHLGFRCAAALMRDMVSKGTMSEFLPLWNAYKKAHAYHSHNEDAVCFPYLDEMSGNYIITRKKVGEDHENEAEFVFGIDAELKANGLTTATFDKWYAFATAHFDKEESVVLAIDSKLGAKLEDRQKNVYKRLIVPSFADPSDLVWCIGWTVGLLCRTGLGDRSPVDCIGLIAGAYQRVTNPKQYEIVKATINYSIKFNSPELWEQAAQVYGLNDPPLHKMPPSKPPLGEDPRFSSFFKMLQYGVAPEAVAVKMVQQGSARSFESAMAVLALNPDELMPKAMEHAFSDL